jgi:hypothetical protein
MEAGTLVAHQDEPGKAKFYLKNNKKALNNVTLVTKLRV